jgi:nitroreductase
MGDLYQKGHIMNPRKPNFPIDKTFIDRWSPRAFTGEAIPENVLCTAFEAARWAPSSANSQPWRFIFVKKGSPEWDKFVGFMVEGNRVWAQNASALVVLLSKKDFEWNGKMADATSHSFDAGAAWMSMAMQLTKDGWAAHAMGGINHDAIRAGLEVPANYAVEVMIAVGKIGDKSKLPEALQSRELQNDRKMLESVSSEAKFKAEWR